MDNKHNSLNLAAKIGSDICPWTLSVPRSSQFSSSFALGKLFASRTDNVRGQISEHIFAPNEGSCLYIKSHSSKEDFQLKIHNNSKNNKNDDDSSNNDDNSKI